jgi:hypothetical protein
MPARPGAYPLIQRLAGSIQRFAASRERVFPSIESSPERSNASLEGGKETFPRSNSLPEAGKESFPRSKASPNDPTLHWREGKRLSLDPTARRKQGKSLSLDPVLRRTIQRFIGGRERVFPSIHCFAERSNASLEGGKETFPASGEARDKDDMPPEAEDER